MAAGRARPATPPAAPAPFVLETDLISAAITPTDGTNSAEVMHTDGQGRLWISQDSDGAAYVRVFDPATHVYTDYTDLTSPNDAQLGPDGNVWWSLDDPASGLARLDLASRTVTTWSVPANAGAGLAFDSLNHVWILGAGMSSILSFDLNGNNLCTIPLANGFGGPFLTEHAGALWLEQGDVMTSGLARITPTTNAYTFWPIVSSGLLAPSENFVVVSGGSVTFAPNGDVWFSSELSGTIGRLETAANLVSSFSPATGFQLQQLHYFLGKVWYTGQTEVSGTIGYLDTATATGTTPRLVTHTTALLSPSCATPGAAITFTAGIRTGVSEFNFLPLTGTPDAQGISYGTPISSQPAALVRVGTNLWLTDQGRNKLVEVVISPTTVYVPFVNR